MQNYDVLIIGKGPAGVSCSLYCARANLNTGIIAKDGGALAKTHALENYYGFIDPIAGPQLLDNGVKQAQRLGVDFYEDEVTAIDYDEGFVVKTKSGTEYKGRALLMATGTSRAKGNIKNLSTFEGLGVSYCAVCDAFFYRKKTVAVVGKGAYALHEAQELAAVVGKVYILLNGEEAEVEFPDTFEVISEKIASVEGNEKLEKIVFKNDEELNVDGLFMAIGTAGSAEFAKKLGVEVDGKTIVVDKDMKTSVPGLYAAGDCVGGIMQVAKCVSEGAIAAADIIKLVREQKKSEK